jgi:alkanesulfonate monooxygenase SsuD/methylene tetrahydromethanopterin reductase-like flavin-dependent oxidoreductase (luciferase family)
MKPSAFAEYLRVVRALLAGEEVEFSHEGRTRAIRFLHRDRHFIDLEHPIPIYVAANGPGALRAAGAYGDGRISALHEPPELTQRSLALVAEGASRAGRTLGQDFHTAALTTAVVLAPGERLTSERVVDECGSQVAAALHYLYEVHQKSGDDAVIPPSVGPIYQAYRDYVEKMQTPAEKRYLQLHEGHCTYLVPEERRFVTPEAIRTFCLVGEPDEILDQLRAAERAGLREITLLPPMDHARKVFRDFAQQVIARW